MNIPKKFFKDKKVVLLGIAGSRAHGLATSHSDYDLRGIYVAHAWEALSLNKPKEVLEYQNAKLDVVCYEIEKYINLALNANPTILELLWLEEWLKKTPEGRMLVENRHAFLSKKIHHTYMGYAKQQFAKIKPGKRGAIPKEDLKKVRHTFRLLAQGYGLWKDGSLSVKADRDYLFSLEKERYSELTYKFEKQMDLFDKTPTNLPDEPQYGLANKILLDIRHLNP